MKTFDRKSVKHLRLAHGLSQAAFGRKVGISRQLVFNLEKGLNEPNLETLTKMAAPFHLDLDYFFDDAHTTTLHNTSNSTPKGFVKGGKLEKGEGA
jgi:transcriptional regulator with XRE-family HTH domain